MARRETDPLDVIPTTRAVERWLTAAEERVRRLRILLSTAREIETDSAVKIQTGDPHTRSCGEEASHA